MTRKVSIIALAAVALVASASMVEARGPGGSGGGLRPERPQGGPSGRPGGSVDRICFSQVKEACSSCFQNEGSRPDGECLQQCVADASLEDITQECKDGFAERAAAKECKDSVRTTCASCFPEEGGRPDGECLQQCVADASLEEIAQECKDEFAERAAAKECKESVKTTCASCFPEEGGHPDGECLQQCVADASLEDIAQECKDKVAQRSQCKTEIKTACARCFEVEGADKKAVRTCVKECVANDDSISEECKKN